MERRDFLKVTVLTGATAALSGCEKPAQRLVRFIPEEDLVPGVATWKPSVCTLCPAGCGLMVRVLQGEAEVVRNGKPGTIQMGLAKKLEGNPNHPVNQGKLCARGHAGLQITYHPDRIGSPLRRSGPRGSGSFQPATWEESLSEVVSRLRELRSENRPENLRFLSGCLRGQRHQLVRKFLTAFGAPPAMVFDPLDEPVLRQANLLSFGQAAMPSFDLAHTSYVISFGADFLGTWNSPVAQSVGYGEMRQGRPGSRGKFIQVEQRMSQTGANADEWIAPRPGTEGVMALGLAHVVLKEKLRPHLEDSATRLIAGWSEGLPGYTAEQVEKRTGIPAKRIERLAHEMAEHVPAVAIVGGLPLAHTNGLFTALAVNALNALLGSVGTPGGVFFTPRPPTEKSDKVTGDDDFIGDLLAGKLDGTKILLLHNTNPVFATPTAWRVRDALAKIPFIVSFGSFIDETSGLADLILPDHSPLESWLHDVPNSGTNQAVVSLAAPAMQPLHDTRAMPDTLLGIAHQLGGEVAKALPWENFQAMLQASMGPLSTAEGIHPPPDPEKFWSKVQEQGGWWSDKARQSARPAIPQQHVVAEFAPPQFDGDESSFPLHFQPYVSQAFLDGSLAHLPWMQEMPDALSTVMWGTWVEINPKTARKLGIEQDDLVEVRSQHGKLLAPALVSPGIAFDVVAMPMGQGHENFGRYASGRGANPIAILAPIQVAETGSLAWAATSVQVSKVGKAKLALFSGGLFERPSELQHR
jgi:anaerobic selenocysteine-containing dehydrogenase